MTEGLLPAPSPVVPPPAIPPALAPALASPPGAGGRGRGWLDSLDPATRRPTFLVAAIMAGLFFGSQIVNEALPTGGTDQALPGNPIPIGAHAQITPVDGWVASPHTDGSGIRLEKGVVVVDLFPETFGQSAGDLAAAYRDEVLVAGATQLNATDIETTTVANGSAARFLYQGIFPEADSAIEGEVTAVFVAGQGIVSDAWSRQGSLGQLLGEVHLMLGTLEVQP
jgi:hypothetical protein